MIVALFAVLACILAVDYILRRRSFQARLNEANVLYDAAETPEAMARAKAAYAALLPLARGAAERRAVERALTSCDANIAFYEATGQPTIEKYRRAIELMEKAKQLSGDAEGVWAGRIREFREHLQQAMGPGPDEMRLRFERLRALPFAQARMELEALYRWRQLWRERGLYQDDTTRQAILQEVQRFLLDNYARAFEASIAAAKGAGADLVAKAALLAALEDVRRFDERHARDYAEKYAAELAEARKAVQALEAMAK